MIVKRDISIRMRDGVELFCDIFLPRGDGPFPAVLIRTPYNRTIYGSEYFPERGIALVIQDTRGRYGSGGQFYPFAADREDGTDTIEWVRRQAWSNGRIGMFGDSYLAFTQFALMAPGSAGLTTSNPRFMAGDAFKHAYYCHGIFSMALTWSWLCFECASRCSLAGLMRFLEVREVLRHLPVKELDIASGLPAPVPWFRDFVAHDRDDDFWRRVNLRERDFTLDYPVLLTGGWYDTYAAETTDNFQTLRARSATPELAGKHRMLIGPWSHGVHGKTTLGELDFGPEAGREDDHSERWLVELLTGGAPERVLPAPVRIFVMGINRWRDEAEWPPARTRYVELQLRCGGGLGEGREDAAEACDEYVYDPADPVPTHGGNHSIGAYNPGLYDFVKPGPFDQRQIEARADVLSYTAPPFTEATEVTGRITLRLFASSSAVDTDWFARIIDVHPDGRAFNLTEGCLRAALRCGLDSPQPLEPDEIYEYVIDLGVTSNVFLPGHALRLDITSSNFPLFARNLNSGDEKEMVKARQRIYHDRDHHSRLLIPVLPQL